MNRRDFLRTSAALSGAALTSGLAACATTTRDTVTPSPSGSPATTTAQTAEPRGKRALLASFSRPGENYHYGGRTNLDIGNTQRVADMIAARRQC